MRHLALTDKTRSRRARGSGQVQVDWKPNAEKWLKDGKVILHTDHARSYKAKVPGVLHDSVVHQQKRVTVGGKLIRQSPNIVELSTQTSMWGRIRVKA